LFENLIALLRTVRPPQKARVLFIPRPKDANPKPYDEARHDIIEGFRKEGFKNITVIYYDGTKEDLN